MIGVLALLVVYLLTARYVKEAYQWLTDFETYAGDPTSLERLSVAPLSAPTAPSAPGDWPQWRGPNRDGISTETGLLTTWPPTGPRVLWKVAGGPGHSSFAVADGRVCTLFQDGAAEVILCLDAASGKELWRHRSPGQFFEQYAGTGPHATPAIVDGRVYTVGATGMFHCLDAASGKVLWSHDLLQKFQAPAPDYGVSFSPLVEGDLVFTMPGGPAGGAIAAFDRRDGRLVWKALNDQPGYSSPVAATIGGKRQIVFLTGESLVGVGPEDGRLLWQYPWITHAHCNIATPIVVGSYVFVSSGYGKGCALLEITANATGAFAARPVYQHNRMRNHFSTCVLYNDHFYGFDEAYLVCMELRTGKVLWKQRGFQKGSLLVADGRLIVLGENGVLALAEAGPEQYREQATCTISQSKCWAMPVLTQGKLYVRDQENIMCLDLVKSE
jgi:outer membrane protein assembly factor BamB